MKIVEWAQRQQARFQGRDYDADKKAYMEAKQAAEARARGQWAHKKAKEEADNRYGLNKTKSKSFLGSVLQPDRQERKSKRTKVYRDQPRSTGGGLTNTPDIDWGMGGVDLDLGFGSTRRRRRGGVDIDLGF